MTDTNGQAVADSAEQSWKEREFIANEMFARREWLRANLLDRRRDIDAECGHPQVIDKYQYRLKYERNPIANRVTELYPKETWKVEPEVYESEDTKEDTDFEKAWAELPKSIRGRSWAKTEKGNPIWEILRRADILSGIGQYGVILIGIDDGLDMRIPAEGVDFTKDSFQTTAVENATKPRKLTFLRALDESLVDITKWETAKTNPRFGQPTEYNITINDPRVDTAGAGLSTGTYAVHWTRVIHIADNLISSEVLGQPRQKPVFNNILACEKIYGASAEGFWRGAFPGYALETHPQLGGDVKINVTDAKRQIENFTHSLDRWLAIPGIAIKALAPAVVDPTASLSAQIKAICIKLGCPVPVFEGYEIGEQASTNNAKDWNDRIAERQNGHVTPRIIIPFVDRLIQLRVLPEPKEFCVDWPDLNSLSDLEKADIGVKRAQMLAQYVSGGLEAVIDLQDFHSRIVGFSEQEAESIVDQVMTRVEEENTSDSPLLSLVGGLTGITEMFKAAKDGAISEEQLTQLLMLFFKLSPKRAAELIADGIEPPPDPLEMMAATSELKKEEMGTQAALNPKPPAKAPPFAANYDPKFISNALHDLADWVENQEEASDESSNPFEDLFEPITDNDCGTGAGGFKAGNRCAVGGASVKAIRAKANAVRVDHEIQRYSEEHNEPALAKAIGGKSLKDNEPVDVVTTIGGKTHGIELKTMTVGANRKLTMKGSAMERKAAWERKNKGTTHTVVFDDTKVFNAKGKGKHDLSKRRIFYRRGYGSFRVDGMHEVTGGMAELKALMTSKRNQITKAAGGTK